VRIHQTNTNCILEAKVEISEGKASVNGNAAIDGVPGTGSPIWLNFSDSVGSTTGKLLPTGNPRDLLDVVGYGQYEYSIVDAGNVVVFIRAENLGLSGTESCAAIESNAALKNLIEAIRATATVKIGIAKSCAEATEKSAYAPFFSIVSPAADYISELTGLPVDRTDVDLVARLSFMLHMHKTYPGTGAVATGAAARIPGTIVYDLLSNDSRARKIMRIGHPGGIMEIETRAAQNGGEITFETLSYMRTARRIMEGTVFVRDDQ
jgi:2-methylaconitate cis-trans-isomerase PrpF